MEDINSTNNGLIAKENTIVSDNAKVARFSYTESSYNNDNADGVEEYSYDNEQNIPLGTADVLSSSESVLNKGFRAQASSVSRQLINHFFGRTSYNLNKINDIFSAFLTSFKRHLAQDNHAYSATTTYYAGDTCLVNDTVTVNNVSYSTNRGFRCLDPSGSGITAVPPITGGVVDTTNWQESNIFESIRASTVNAVTYTGITKEQITGLKTTDSPTFVNVTANLTGTASKATSDANGTNIHNHIISTANPHAVTKEQITGLKTTDSPTFVNVTANLTGTASKATSDANGTNIHNHIISTANPHAVTKEQITGLKTTDSPTFVNVTANLTGTASKATSDANGTNIHNHIISTANPHAVTKEQITGLKTTDSPTFAGATINGSLIVVGGVEFNSLPTSTILSEFASPGTHPFGLAIMANGNLVSCDYDMHKIYIHSGVSSTILSSFDSPGTHPSGLAITANGNLVSCDYDMHKIYIHSGVSSTILSSFDSPGTNPRGLAIMANGNLVSCDYYPTHKIYIHSGVSSTILSSFDSPGTNPRGLAIMANGNLVSCDYDIHKIYIHSGVSSTILSSFDSPGTHPRGLAITANGNLVSCDYYPTHKIYIHKTDSPTFAGATINGSLIVGGVAFQPLPTATILSSFASPGKSPFGLAIMANGNLVSCDIGTHKIYIHSGVSSTILSSFDSPSSNPRGLAIMANGNLVSCDFSKRKIYIHDGVSSTILSSFAAPGTNPFGLATMANGNLVSCDYGTIYIHSGVSSTILSSFATPSSNPRGLAIMANGNLVSCDFSKRKIYIHDGVSSTILSSFAAPGMAPHGIEIMSNGNLVSCDEDTDMIYIHKTELAVVEG